MTQQLYNHRVEQTLIGVALYDPAELDMLSVEPTEYYVERHQRIWAALLQMRAADLMIDITTLCDVLDRQGVLAEIGGPAYLVECMTLAPPSGGADSYARILSDYAARRRALAAAQELAAACHDLDAPIADAATRALERIQSGGTSEPQHIAIGASAVYDQVVAAHNAPRSTWGVPTGLRDVDHLIHGLRYGEVMYLIGKPGGGKSKLALQIALNAARAGYTTVYYSLEMPRDDLVMRAASALAATPTVPLQTGTAGADEMAKFFSACEALERLPLYILDDPTLSVSDLAGGVLRMRRRYDARLVVIDYVQLLNLPAWQVKNRTEHEVQDQITRQLKQIARRSNVAILAIGSVVKSGMDDGDASMTHMRGGGASIHHADVICELVPSRDIAGAVDLVFTKVRSTPGARSRVSLRAESQYPAFYDIDTVSLSSMYGVKR